MIDTILLNLVKMLSTRGVLLDQNIEKNYNDLLKQKTEELIFKINSEKDNSIYYVMIITSKISTLKKIQGIDGFLTLSKGNNRIFIGEDIAQKAYKQFLELKKSEIFYMHELMINLIEHDLQPKFELLTKEEKENKLREYNIDLKNISKILSIDPVVRYYNAKTGDIFRIIRYSPLSGHSFHYRVVIEAPVSLLYK